MCMRFRGGWRVGGLIGWRIETKVKVFRNRVDCGQSCSFYVSIAQAPTRDATAEGLLGAYKCTMQFLSKLPPK